MLHNLLEIEYTQLQDSLTPTVMEKITVEDWETGIKYPDLRFVNSTINKAMDLVLKAFESLTQWHDVIDHNYLLQHAIDHCDEAKVTCLTPLLILARSLTLDHQVNGQVIRGLKHPERAKELLSRVLRSIPEHHVAAFKTKEAELLKAHKLDVIVIE